MVHVDPFDIWITMERPTLTLKYQHGDHIPLFSYEQMREAFEAGMKAQPRQTITVSSAMPSIARVLREQRTKRARNYRRG